MNQDKPIIAERIKTLRKEKGYTQEQLAEVLGLNAKSSIANYESGANSPSDEIKSKMCEIFNCSMDYLMGKNEFRNKDIEMNTYIDIYNNSLFSKAIFETRDLFKDIPITLIDLKEFCNTVSKCAVEDNENGDMIIQKYFDFYVKKGRTRDEQEKITSALSKFLELSTNLFIKERKVLDEKKNGDIVENVNYKSTQYYMCPVYGQISAGQPNWAEECIEGRLPIDPELMGIVNPEEHFFLRVNGESMNNVVKNGAFALIHRQDIVDDGEIAVVLVNGYDATLKRFTQKGDVVILEPDSKDDSFKIQVYDKTTTIKILGKYVGKMEINK